MKEKLFRLLDKMVSADRIRKNAEEIHRLEGNESFCNYKASTDFCMEMLKEAGFEQIERIALPADGKTTYFDCVMPQAWETTGRSFICLEDETLTMDDRLIADSAKDPFNAGVWGAPTPEGGVDCEIVDIRITGWNAGTVCGKLVLMDGFSQDQYKFAALSGAAGVIISGSRAGEQYPDHCRWCNAIGYTGWYMTAEDKRIPVFLISPRREAFLRHRLSLGKVTAHAEARCRVYDGEIYTVTGIVPGKSGEEITMIAHMYEPFLPDDAAGGAVIAEICRCLKTLIEQKQLPALKKTLRVVLSMERYGYSQYFLNRERNKKTLTVFSFDSCCHAAQGKDFPRIRLRLSSMLQPSFLDLLIPEMLRSDLPDRRFVLETGTLSDDTFCSDDWIGIPSVWTHSSEEKYHHNAGPAFMEADWNLAHDIASLMGTVIGKLATGDRKDFSDIRRKCAETAGILMKDKCAFIEHELEYGKISCRDAAEKVRYYERKYLRQLASVDRYCPGIKPADDAGIKGLSKYAVKTFRVPEGGRELFGAGTTAARTVVTRLVPGTLMSMARVPQPERRRPKSIPDVLYMLFDGKRSVYEAVKLYEYENDAVFSEAQLMKIMSDLLYLEKYGYVSLKKQVFGCYPQFLGRN